jgi:hypothetical protein
MGLCGHRRGPPVREDLSRGIPAGLSWLTILRKREAFRRAFAGFDFRRVARFGARDVTRPAGDAGIVRPRGKIESAISNARRACDLVDECGSLAAYIWRFEPPADARPSHITPEVLRRLTTARGVHGPVDGPAPARMAVRRADDNVCVHAGDGPGERSGTTAASAPPPSSPAGVPVDLSG